jgi:hypothetical protein
MIVNVVSSVETPIDRIGYPIEAMEDIHDADKKADDRMNAPTLLYHYIPTKVCKEIRNEHAYSVVGDHVADTATAYINRPKDPKEANKDVQPDLYSTPIGELFVPVPTVEGGTRGLHV